MSVSEIKLVRDAYDSEINYRPFLNYNNIINEIQYEVRKKNYVYL